MTTTTGSSNISVLDSKIIADLCAGKFYIDVTPSLYIGDGATLVTGANVQITNPYGVIVKNYGPNYEIAPALSGGMNGVVSFSIPTQVGAYQYGKYIIDVKLFDGDLSWVVSKPHTICPPDPKNKFKNVGSLSALLNASCKDGKLFVIVDNVPNYNGQIVESQVLDLTLEYPTSSGLDPLETSIGSFSVLLFEGVYKATGDICATYNFGDNKFVKVKYTIKKEKNVRCLLDECCVVEKLAEIHEDLKSDCTVQEREAHTEVVLDALRLLKTAKLTAQCGGDPSEYIEALEALLRCKCTCNCADGTPIIDNTPSKDFVIEGCNVEKETVGNTDHYTINAYAYEVGYQDNGGVLVVTAQTLDGCTKRQTIIYDNVANYNKVKALANQTTEEALFWASVVNKSLLDIDPACLGITQGAWNNYTFKQKFSALLNKVCSCCGCSSAIDPDSVDVSNSGADVTVEYDAPADATFIEAYLDGVFQQRILITGSREDLRTTFAGAANGVEHLFTLIPYCANGSAGTLFSGTFSYLGCPDIAPPVVSSNNVNGVECPYDLTTLLSTPPVGITVEWHTANNTSASSLVGDPTSVSSGIYYAFAKDSNGCYSIATTVTLICSTGTSCSAPQNLQVSMSGGNANVTFQSAAFPPPSNSYTVKRKLATDPDIDGSYTTIGTPVWNSTINRWQIFDSTIAANTLYTYKAISNCGGSPGSSPAAYFTFANLTCASVIVTSHTDSLDYSLATTGSNQIDQYQVLLYDSTGTILLHTDTYTPAFANPITGTFTYLTPGTAYKIVVKACIGSYCATSCSTVNASTTNENYLLDSSLNMSIDSVTGTNAPALGSTGVNGQLSGHHTGLSGSYNVAVSGATVPNSKLQSLVNGVVISNVNIAAGPGTYAVTINATEGQDVRIQIIISL